VFSSHAAELQSSVQRDLEALALGIREDERTREDRLRQADAELERLRSLAAQAGALVDELLGAGRTAATR
jgi:hypothetical protein